MYKHVQSANAVPRSIQAMSCDRFSSAVRAGDWMPKYRHLGGRSQRSLMAQM